MADSPIKIANANFSINDACIEIGIGDVSGMAKTYCPFGSVFHVDGGRSRAFKVYPESNSAYCFACQQYFTPVGLVAQDRDITPLEAANYILEKIGWVKPNYEDQWQALAERVTEVDYDALKEALKLACGRMAPSWETLQLDQTVSAKLNQCFGLVRKVTNDEEAREWLSVTKEAMKTVIERSVAATRSAS